MSSTKSSRQTSSRTVETTSSYDDDEYVFPKEERKEFVAKIYAILSSYPLLASIMIIFLMNSEDLSEWIMDHRRISLIVVVCLITLYVVCGISETLQRCFPLNLILFAIMVILYATTLSSVAARRQSAEQWEFLLEQLTFTCYTILISLFAKCSPWDVTGPEIFSFAGAAVVFVYLVVFATYGLFAIVPVLHFTKAAFIETLLILCKMLVTRRILLGRHGDLEPDEVFFGVILVFTSFLQLLKYIIRWMKNLCTG